MSQQSIFYETTERFTKNNAKLYRIHKVNKQTSTSICSSTVTEEDREKTPKLHIINEYLICLLNFSSSASLVRGGVRCNNNYFTPPPVYFVRAQARSCRPALFYPDNHC